MTPRAPLQLPAHGLDVRAHDLAGGADEQQLLVGLLDERTAATRPVLAPSSGMSRTPWLPRCFGHELGSGTRLP